MAVTIAIVPLIKWGPFAACIACIPNVMTWPRFGLISPGPRFAARRTIPPSSRRDRIEIYLSGTQCVWASELLPFGRSGRHSRRRGLERILHRTQSVRFAESAFCTEG